MQVRLSLQFRSVRPCGSLARARAAGVDFHRFHHPSSSSPPLSYIATVVSFVRFRVMENSDELSKEDMEYIEVCRKLYNTICDKFPPNFGKALSRRERDKKELFLPNLVYSEISFDALATVITKIVQKYSKISEIGPLPNGPVFCDLGSGIGKTLIAASLLFNFSSCHGIELLEALHRGAEWVLESYHALESEIKKTHGKLPAMRVVEGDFLNLQLYDWRKADLLFINASCYGDEILTEIMKLSMKMKKGAFVVSVSFAIPHKEFVMCEYSEHDMSYGKANVFIQQKATDPHEYVEPVAEDEDRGEGEDEDGEQEHGGGGEGGDAR